MRPQTVIPLLLGITLCLTAHPALAVIVFLKGQDQPVRGYLVRATEEVVVIDQVLADDTIVERTIPRSNIDDMIQTVSATRLEALQPDDPDKYREYAEELAEKSKDPDAQIAAIRLFLIAAHLAPDRLGRSCLLGMVPLARSDAEQRRFRGMAYLLDPAHDPDLLTMPVQTTARKGTLDQVQAAPLIRALRLLRQGKQREALAQSRRSKMKERLPLLTDGITLEEFKQACELSCPHCERGHQECPQCNGRKIILGQSCVTCGASGEISCPYCGGDYRTNKIPSSLLKRIVQLELDWLPTAGPAAALTPPPRTSWSHSVQQGRSAPFSAMTLESLTEFDPRQNTFRDGEWTS